MLELYLGGARSGKSKLAETQAEQQAVVYHKQLIYVATAGAGDEEMARRIKQHKRQRSFSAQWSNAQTIEEPYALADTLRALDDKHNCIVVDCLTLWVSNLLLHPDTDRWLIERQRLLDCLCSLNSHIIFVSNEVGQGVVPANELSRRFVDESGFLHQQIAMLCDRVVFAIAGITQIIKGPPLQTSIPDQIPTIGEL